MRISFQTVHKYAQLKLSTDIFDTRILGISVSDKIQILSNSMYSFNSHLSFAQTQTILFASCRMTICID